MENSGFLSIFGNPGGLHRKKGLIPAQFLQNKRIGKKSQGKYDDTEEGKRQHNQQTNTYDEIYKKVRFLS